PAWLTTPDPSAVTTSFGREDVVFTWIVLRFLDDRDFAIKIIPGGGALPRSGGQDTDSPDERARLVAVCISTSQRSRCRCYQRASARVTSCRWTLCCLAAISRSPTYSTSQQ